MGQHGGQHAGEHVARVGGVALQHPEELVGHAAVDLAADVVAQGGDQRLGGVAGVQHEEDEVAPVREAAGGVDEVERAGVGVAPVGHALDRPLDQQHDVDLVLQAADVVLVGPRGELAEPGQVHDAQVAHLGVRERAVDPDVADREVAPRDRDRAAAPAAFVG